MISTSPHQQIDQMLTGYWLSQAIYVAAKLGLADLLKDGPRTADDLAKTTQTDCRSLHRLLRALASVGIFFEDGQGHIALTPLAERLRSDVAGSKRSLAIMMGEEHYRAWGELLYSVQTGKPSFEKICGMPIFDFLSKNPEQAKVFDQAMVGIHGRETAAVVEAYDLSGVRALADIGGGNGSVLGGVLRKYPKMQGILFDLPHVAERAKLNIEAAGLADRCQVVGGSFFESVPSGADAYLLRHIIHDWDDEKSLTILRSIQRAMSDAGKVLVIESIIPPGNDPCFGKLLDLTMLVLPGGQERTETEYRQLFERAGLRLAQIVPTNADVSVIVGEKA